MLRLSRSISDRHTLPSFAPAAASQLPTRFRPQTKDCQQVRMAAKIRSVSEAPPVVAFEA